MIESGFFSNESQAFFIQVTAKLKVGQSNCTVLNYLKILSVITFTLVTTKIKFLVYLLI